MEITDTQGFSPAAGVGQQSESQMHKRRGQARRLSTLARERILQEAAGRKSMVADRLEDVASQIDKFGKAVPSGMERGQELTGEASQYVRSAATRIRERNPEELLADANDVVRTHPAPFLAGCFALGFLGARFLRS